MAVVRDDSLFCSSSVTREGETDGHFRDWLSIGKADAAQSEDVYAKAFKEKVLRKRREMFLRCC